MHRIIYSVRLSLTQEEEEEQEPAAAVVDPREQFKQALVKFYTETDPKYLNKVDYFLKKYLGQEDRILKGLKKKYGKVLAFDLSTLPKPAAAASASASASASVSEAASANTASSTAGKDVGSKMASLSLKHKPDGPLTWVKVAFDDVEMGTQVSLSNSGDNACYAAVIGRFSEPTLGTHIYRTNCTDIYYSSALYHAP